MDYLFLPANYGWKKKNNICALDLKQGWNFRKDKILLFILEGSLDG